MADRYWVGGTANWDSTVGTKWSATSGGAGGASVPTSADAVFFNAASGTVTVTVATGGGTAQSINCTGFTGTLAIGVNSFVSGSVTFVSGMTLSGLGTLNLLATGTLTTGGKTPQAVSINAPAGTVTLGSALTLANSTSVLTLTAGTLTTSASNFSITSGVIALSGTDAKTLTLNGSTVSLSSSTNPVNYTGSNLTFNVGTSTINLTSSTSATLNAGAGLTFNNLAFTGTGSGVGTDRVIRGANTFNTLTLTSPSSTDYAKYIFEANQTATTFVCSGGSAVRRVLLMSNVVGTQRTLTVGTYTTKINVDFQDIAAAGASSPWSGTRLGNCKGNSNITFDVAKTVYWNLTGTSDWHTNGWATSSGGTPSLNNFPLPQDTAVFDNAGAATSINTRNWYIGSVNSSARTTAMTLTGGSLTVLGDWVAGSGVTQSFAGGTSFNGRTTQTITSNGQVFAAIQSNSPSTVISLANALTAVDEIAISSTSSFNANSYSVTTAKVTVGTGALINLGTASWTITGTGTCWSAVAGSVSGTAALTLSDNTTTSRTFAGGGNTYGKLTLGGTTSVSTTTFTGTNTFSELASTKTVAHTIVFPNVTTTVGAFSVRGTVGNVVTLSRTGASGTFTLAKSGAGVIDSDYLSISNSTATPTNTWYAGANSTNGGGNTNWIFTAAPPAAGGNFFSLF